MLFSSFSNLLSRHAVKRLAKLVLRTSFQRSRSSARTRADCASRSAAFSSNTLFELFLLLRAGFDFSLEVANGLLPRSEAASRSSFSRSVSSESCDRTDIPLVLNSWSVPPQLSLQSIEIVDELESL